MFLSNVFVMQKHFFKKDLSQATFISLNSSIKQGKVLIDSESCQYDKLFILLDEYSSSSIMALFQLLLSNKRKMNAFLKNLAK